MTAHNNTINESSVKLINSYNVSRQIQSNGFLLLRSQPYNLDSIKCRIRKAAKNEFQVAQLFPPHHTLFLLDHHELTEKLSIFDFFYNHPIISQHDCSKKLKI